MRKRHQQCSKCGTTAGSSAKRHQGAGNGEATAGPTDPAEAEFEGFLQAARLLKDGRPYERDRGDQALRTCEVWWSQREETSRARWWELVGQAARREIWFPGLWSLCLQAGASLAAQPNNTRAGDLVRAGLQYFRLHEYSLWKDEPNFIDLLRQVKDCDWYQDQDTLRRVLVLLGGRGLALVKLGARADLLAHDLNNVKADDFCTVRNLYERDPVCLLSLDASLTQLVQVCRNAVGRAEKAVGQASSGWRDCGDLALRALARAGLTTRSEEEGLRKTVLLGDVLEYFEKQVGCALERYHDDELRSLVPRRAWTELDTYVTVQPDGAYYADGAGLRRTARLHWLLLETLRKGRQLYRAWVSEAAPRSTLPAGPLPSLLAFAWSYAVAATHLQYVCCEVNASAPVLSHLAPLRTPAGWPRVLGWDDPIVYNDRNAWVLAWWLRRGVRDPDNYDWQRNVGFKDGYLYFGMGHLESWGIVDGYLPGGVDGKKLQTVVPMLKDFRWGDRQPFARLYHREISFSTIEKKTDLDRGEGLLPNTSYLAARYNEAGQEPYHTSVWFVDLEGIVWFYDPGMTCGQDECQDLAETLQVSLGLECPPEVRSPEDDTKRYAEGESTRADQSEDSQGEGNCSLLSLARALLVSYSGDRKDLRFRRRIGHPWLLLVSFIWQDFLMDQTEKALFHTRQVVRRSERSGARKLGESLLQWVGVNEAGEALSELASLGQRARKVEPARAAALGPAPSQSSAADHARGTRARGPPAPPTLTPRTRAGH